MRHPGEGSLIPHSQLQLPWFQFDALGMMKQERKRTAEMAKTLLRRKPEASAEGQLTELFAKLVEKEVSSISVSEARNRKNRVDKLIDEALASRPKRRGRR
jgi:hypothetical protein